MNTEITQQFFIYSYWNYFVELEEQLISTKRFVDFDISNNKTFSLEYLKLLQATCSEIDVVAKVIAEWFDPSFKSITKKNIKKWGYVIQNHIPGIDVFVVRFHHDYEIIPWHNWKYEKCQDKKGNTQYRLLSGCETPCWWIAYNKVKHERTFVYEGGQTNYVRANLGNLVSAMAALYILEIQFLTILDGNGNTGKFKKSKLFELLSDGSNSSL